MQIRRLTHIGICVSDLERSLAFYRDALGCEEVGRLVASGPMTEHILALPGVELEAVYLERDGYRLELLHYRSPAHLGPDSPRPMNQLGLTHLSFRVEDMESVCKAIETAGGTILRDRSPIAAVPAGLKMATDPDGLLIELIEKPGDPTEIPSPDR